MSGVNPVEQTVEELRKRLRKMTDNDLLLFGQAAKYMCSPEANYGPPREPFLIQLKEARAEWRKRHPKPPLDDSI
jgi:hypothetical protein